MQKQGQKQRNKRARKVIAQQIASTWNTKCRPSLVPRPVEEIKKYLNRVEVERSKSIPLNSKGECLYSLEPVSKIAVNLIKSFPARSWLNKFEQDIVRQHVRAQKDHTAVFNILSQGLHHNQLCLRLVGEFCVDHKTSLTLFQQELQFHCLVPLVLPSDWTDLRNDAKFHFLNDDNCLKFADSIGMWSWIILNAGEILTWLESRNLYRY